MKKEKKGGLARYADEKLIKYLLLIESMLSDGMDSKAKESALQQYSEISFEIERRNMNKVNPVKLD